MISTLQVLVNVSFTRLAKVLVDKILVSINKKIVLALHPNELFSSLQLVPS